MEEGDSDPMQELIEAKERMEENRHSAVKRNGTESAATVSASQSETSQTVGNLIEGMMGALSTEQKLALAAGSVVLLASMSGEGKALDRSSSDVECPECGSSKSKRGMDGHLRWGHDLDGDELQEAREKAGIGG
jgi:N-methylhydantoinase B/oxoprolinase/acetone carboxylase alpha subunit